MTTRPADKPQYPTAPTGAARGLCALVTALCLASLTAPAGAETATQPAQAPVATTQPTTQPGSNCLDEQGGRPLVTAPEGGSGRLWALMASVLVILVLGGVAMIVVRRVLPKLGVTSSRRVRVLETTHLGARKAVHLLQVGSQRFLIGSTRERITHLAEVTMAFLDEDNQAADAKTQLDRKIQGD